MNELEVALDASNENRIMPEFRDSDTAVLDIGCGIGQTFLAAKLDPKAVCLRNGHRYGISAVWSEKGTAKFVQASGDELPFASGSFALVIARVSLPYTNVLNAIKEIR